MKYPIYYDPYTLTRGRQLRYYVVDNSTRKAYISGSVKQAIDSLTTYGWPMKHQSGVFTHHICDCSSFEHFKELMPELFI